MTSKRVLVVNAGSSSLKFKLYDVLSQSLQPVVGGLIERIGDTKNSSITIKVRFILETGVFIRRVACFSCQRVPIGLCTSESVDFRDLEASQNTCKLQLRALKWG
jgi:Acetokinase family